MDREHANNTMFFEAYEAHADAIFRMCYFKTSDRETAKDLTQDTFMRVWDSLQKGTEVKNMKAFLFKTANNLIIDHRRKKRPEAMSAVDPEGALTATLSQNIQDPGISSEHREALETISRLDDPCRNVIVLRHVEGLSVSEIAEIIGKKPNAVSVMLGRCTQKLRALLHHEK